MGAMGFTPRVRDRLNTVVINNFDSGVAAGTGRISGLLDVCQAKSASAVNVVALVLGKNMRVRRRDPNSDEVIKRATSIHEHRARLGTYVDWLSVQREKALYPSVVDELAAGAAQLGMGVAEAPTRLIEALVPASLAITCHTGEPFFAETFPIRPGSAITTGNVMEAAALDFDTFDEAEQRLAQIKDEDGRSCGSRVRVLAVGQKYKRIAQEIIQNKRPKDYAGGDNLRADDGVRAIVVPDWDDEFWGVFDTDVPNDAPYYLAKGRDMAIKPVYIDPEEPLARLNNELLWGLEGDMAACLGNPRRALLAVKDTDPAYIAAIVAKYTAKFELNDFDFPAA